MRIFISYRRADLGGHAEIFVGRIADRLNAHFGESNVFLDIQTIPAGREFDEFIIEQVVQADALLVIIGPDWLTELQACEGKQEDFVKLEIQTALDRRIHLIPVLIGGASMPSSKQLPETVVQLSRKNAFTVDSGRDFHHHLVSLIDELETLLQTVSTQAVNTQQVTPLTGNELAQELFQLSDDKLPPSSSTHVGGFNLSDVTGSTINMGNVSANVSAGGDIVGNDKSTTSGFADPNSPHVQLEVALSHWQQRLQIIIDNLYDEDDREYAEKTVSKVTAEAQKGVEADPAKIESFLDKLINMAPDILEITASTLQNSFKGVGLVLEKINDRIKLERQK